MIGNKTLAGLLLMAALILAGCDAFKIAGQFQSGRQAFVANKYAEALAYFQKVAAANPDYMFHSVLYRQGVWGYLGRAQYHLGNFPAARRSLEKALAVYRDEYLARIYLGMTFARTGDRAAGVREMENGMKGLHGWLEDNEASFPHTSLWDPQREIRSALETELAMIEREENDWQRLWLSGEWLGPRMEDEIDRVRRQERERDD
jgi:tetratricopeptide (TPR) repeat protein